MGVGESGGIDEWIERNRRTLKTCSSSLDRQRVPGFFVIFHYHTTCNALHCTLQAMV